MATAARPRSVSDLVQIHSSEPEKRAREVDSAGLRRALTKAIEGEVRFDRASIGLYATDSSNFRQIPIGVVVPGTEQDVVLTHRICSRFHAPIVNRGTGTSLSGETVNFAVVIDHSKYLTHIGETDVENRLVTVQPGAINEVVNKHTGRHNLVFGPDPSTHAYCTIGGNVGNNSCGIHSVQSQIYGPGPRTSDNVESLDIVTYQGDRFRVGVNEESELENIIRAGGAKGEMYRQLRDLRDRYAHSIRKRYRPVTELPRRVSGYNLDELLPERGFNVARALVGTEGTCATALQITLKLTPALLKRVTLVVQYHSLEAAAEHTEEILGWKPIALEAIDQQLFDDESLEHMEAQGLREMPRAGTGAWLLIQFGADSYEEVDEVAGRFGEWLIHRKRYDADRIRIFPSREEHGTSELIWKIREGGLGATSFPPGSGDHWPGWEDSAVPPNKVAPYVRDLKNLYSKYGYRGAMYGHIGQGCVHSRISFDLRTAQGIRQYRSFLDEASDLVVSYGGSLSGEHGDGQQRAEFLGKQYGPEILQAMREFKSIWDPLGGMNPGKVVDPYPVDSYLKLGAGYSPMPVTTKFSYQDDGGSFAHATVRCVGAGKCREPHGVDVMCPSYIVTKEEKHTTRGRARLLFEMLQGDVIRDGWQSKEVYDALDLCLACKGCSNDCPVHVDMPTYKSEFLYHHYKSPFRNRKRYMYAFGFIDQFSRIASLHPGLVNFFTQTPGFSRAAKFLAGMDHRRSIPEFAPLTLQQWFQRRGGTVNKTGPAVILWPDTFNNHFHTQVGVAAVESLEAAGFRVLMPQKHVCCGRPLYDYGFLDIAEKYLRRTLDLYRDEIRAGTPLIGMEPSCLAVFKDELIHMLPNDQDAQRLAKTSYHWAEFFQEHHIPVPKLDGEAVMWGHCHHKATGGVDPEINLLKKGMGLQVTEAKGGCCGLAGSWGFEEGRYDLSMQCGEIGWLPAARKASKSTLLVANGFSCKTQLEQSNVGREALHVAEVMAMAGKLASHRVSGAYPERLREPRPAAPASIRFSRAAGTAAAVTVTGIALFRLFRGNRKTPRASLISKR